MEKLRFNKKNIITIIFFLIVVAIFVTFNKKQTDNIKPETKTTTVAECVALSSEVRINEKTKECFDNLSMDEFLSLVNNEENMKLYNEVGAFYDKRTEAQKSEDEKKNKEFFGEAVN